MVVLLFLFRNEIPPKKTGIAADQPVMEFSADSVLAHAKESLNPGQLNRVMLLEGSLSRGDIKDQKIHIYHQLAKYWADSVKSFLPSIWYRAEAARLENSEKNLTFAAHLLLDSVREQEDVRVRKWEALQAKDLFERSLKINPANDSSKVGLGSCYLFGGISEMPMEGIMMIREVVARDSTNIYAQMMLGYGSLVSGQYDKAIERFEKVLAIDNENIEASLMLVRIGEENEKNGDIKGALALYRKALPFIKKEWKPELQKRIDELSK